jgi:hypothetical protein
MPRTEADQAYLHELIIWRCLRHDNIVPLIGTSEQFPVSLVSEWMSGGTVTAFLREHPHWERSSLVSRHEPNAESLSEPQRLSTFFRV